MNLKLTTREFLNLMKAAYLADCMANTPAESPDEINREISSIRRKIFSHAKEAGFAELVIHHPEHDEFLETEEFARDMEDEFIVRYAEHLFWHELRARLTDKIMDARFGAEMDGWSSETYRSHRAEIEAKVESELSANGIDNLFLLGDFRT